MLSEKEIVQLTGKKRFTSQQSALRIMGIPHRVRPDGKVVVIDLDLPIAAKRKDNHLVNLDLRAI